MNKRAILALALAFVVGITFTAFAEVQNVKVGGDMTMKAVSRNGFGVAASRTLGDRKDDNRSFFLSQVGINIGADLTDNVATTVRLLNERAWDAEGTTNTDIDLDLAYVTLKEFLYSPLTLTVGRQNMFFGNGLIIGDGNNYSTALDTLGNKVPNDLSSRASFDAIRATLNYDPLVVDMFFARVSEGTTVNRNDNNDLYGINAKYNVSKVTSIEAYMFAKTDDTQKNAVSSKGAETYTFGTLLATEPVENLKTSLEFAYQLGKASASATDTNTRRRSFAVQGMADYYFKGVKMDPVVGLALTYLSGDKNNAERGAHAWDPMYETQTPNIITNAIFPNSNVCVTNVKGSIKPKDDVTLAANYGFYISTSKLDSVGLTNTYTGAALGMNEHNYLGSELDLTAKYDYTEDVQLGLDLGVFEPGSAFNSATSTASQVLGSMKVTF